MSELRKVKIQRGDGNFAEGYFHLWGRRPAYDEGNNVFPITVGIVELEDGRVFQVDPEQITFTS